jgi:hypothetical protein
LDVELPTVCTMAQDTISRQTMKNLPFLYYPHKRAASRTPLAELTLEQIFKRVTRDVQHASSGRQVSWVSYYVGSATPWFLFALPRWCICPQLGTQGLFRHRW